MLVSASLLGALLLLPPQTPAAPHASAHAAHHQTTAAEKPAASPQPKTAEELKKEIQARLAAAPFAGDKVECQIADGNVTLGGTVHNAEHKGLATRLTREIAEKSGWGTAHVYNRIAVELPQLEH